MIPINKIYEVSTLFDYSVCTDSRMPTNEFVSFKKILHKSAMPISIQHKFRFIYQFSRSYIVEKFSDKLPIKNALSDKSKYCSLRCVIHSFK